MSDDYFLEIEAHFASRRGTPFLMSAKDWALMQEWASEGVPLAIVIEAIDSVFDKAAERKKVVNGLRYCRHAVKELWSERRDLQIGADAEAPEESALPRLDALAEALESSPEPAVAGFAVRVRGLATEKSVPRIEERLIELEDELIDTLLARPEASTLRGEAAALSAGANEKTRERTEQANLRRLVRDRFDLPRLTLF